MSNTKAKRYFYVSEKELEFLTDFQKEKGAANLSHTLSALIAGYQTLKAKQKEYQQAVKIMRAAARDAHLCLLLLNNRCPDWQHQLFNPRDSEMLKDARAHYQQELSAARTKKSHAHPFPAAKSGGRDPYADEDGWIGQGTAAPLKQEE